jgi:hypothetical protein
MPAARMVVPGAPDGKVGGARASVAAGMPAGCGLAGKRGTNTNPGMPSLVE